MLLFCLEWICVSRLLAQICCFVLVYQDLNMDIFFTKTHRIASEGIYYPPGAVCITFMIDALF